MKPPIDSDHKGLPDFLLVGAAKSATSSLHFYLDQHPQIAMASLKESWFFSFYKKPPDYSSPSLLDNVITELEPYLQLYEAAGNEQLRGDACPSYLYTYEDTIRNIRELYSDAALARLKIVISLREPVSRAYSQYYTFKRYLKEPLSFEQAFEPATVQRRLQDNWNIFYDYPGFGMYSKQVEAFQQAFGKERVMVVLFEDVNADIQKTCRDIYRFLGVDPEFSVDDSHKHNSLAGEPKVKWIVAALFSTNPLKRMISALIPKKLRMIIIYIIFKPLLKRQAMQEEMRRRLAAGFEQDIADLEQLIDRDLSSWRV